jgi:hypothetical protein
VARLTDLNLDGSHLNLDGGFDSRRKRKAIFNAGLIPNIKENPRKPEDPEARAKALFQSRHPFLRLCVERTFAWEDKFKRLLLRLEFTQQRHCGMKWVAYTSINLTLQFALNDNISSAATLGQAAINAASGQLPKICSPSRPTRRLIRRTRQSWYLALPPIRYPLRP